MFDWDKDSVTKLRQLHREGYSNAEIAAKIGGINRASVAGKSRRLGLSRRKKNVIPHSEGYEIKGIEWPAPAMECKWPFGDPMSDDFYFCSKTTKGGKPYCEEHYRLAHINPRRTQKGLKRSVR